MSGVPQILLASGAASGGGGGDPNFASVSLLLPMNGANNGTVFTDASSFAHAITRQGATPPITSTAQSKWGGSSYLSTTANCGLTMTGSGSNEFQYPGDFSIEAWMRFTATGDQYPWDHDAAGNNTVLVINPSTGLVKVYNGGFIINAGATPFNTNQWYFIQVIRSGTTVTVAVDGASYQTGTSAATLGAIGGNQFGVGGYQGSSISVIGNMQDFRVTKGVARTIAVPSAAFPTF